MAIEVHPFISGKWQANLPLPIPENWYANGGCFAYMPANVNVTSIFLGTFPTFEVVNNVPGVGYNLDFYYGSAQNNFWPLLNVLTEMPIANVNQCAALLNASRFGLSDILAVTGRIGQNGGDLSLVPVLFNNIVALRGHFPNLQNIYVTSGGAGVIANGGLPSTGKWLFDSFTSLGLSPLGFNIPGCRKHLGFANGFITFNYYALYSPSRNANVALQGILSANPALAEIVNQLDIEGNPLFKLRVLQWAFLLRLNGFAVNPVLAGVIAANAAFFNVLW